MEDKNEQMIEETEVEHSDDKDTSKSKKLQVVSIAMSISVLALSVVLIVVIAFRFNQLSNKCDRLDSAISQSYNMLQTISEIQELYDENSIKNDVDFDVVADTMTHIYVSCLKDKYAAYLSPEEAKSNSRSDEDYCVGIGASVIYEKEKGYFINEVYSGSPAEKAGIVRGDYLIKIKGVDTRVGDYVTISNSLSSEIGDHIPLTYLHDDNEIETELIAEKVYVDSVNAEILDNGIGYIKITQFGAFTDEEFKRAMNKFKSDEIDNIILDLRGNHGGYLDSVIDIVDYVVPAGKIVDVTDKDNNVVNTYKSDSSEYNANIVILVNGETASASELFTQSLKEYDKATVIGTNTYGKGTVLSVYPLSNDGAFITSTGRYLTKNGTYLEDVGVQPDIEIDLPEDKKDYHYNLTREEDNQLQRAVEYLTTGK